MTDTDYIKTLKKTAILFEKAKDRTLTAAELAELSGCSKPTAYDRIRGLEEFGFEFKVKKGPRAYDGVPGPTPKVFQLIRKGGKGPFNSQAS